MDPDAKKVEPINDPNEGNGPNTYWKPRAGLAGRDWCVRVDGELLRDAKGRVRRFGTKEAAVKAGQG